MMQTYLHLSVGALVGQVLFPNDPVAQVMVFVGSGISDTASATMFFVDKAKGRKPFYQKNDTFVLCSNVLHSLVVWLWPWFVTAMVPLACGVYSHLLLDVISHRQKKGKMGANEDPSWIWPLPFKLQGLFDYRHEDLSDVLFSPWQIAIAFIALAGAATLLLKRM
jgi:hypothetical protein